MAGSEKFSHEMTPAMQQAAENGALGYGVDIRESHAFTGEEVYKSMKQMLQHEASESELEKKMEMD